jgi:hypothetical protein
MDTSQSQIETLIEAFARHQGRASGLPPRSVETDADLDPHE